MKVTLLSTTPHALELLLFTRQTRLTMTPAGLADILSWPEERKVAEWAHAMNTIQSSWEFVDYVFAIEGVSRAFTHQLVRHRVGTSFAQQTQRALDLTEGFAYVTPPDVSVEQETAYDAAMDQIKEAYRFLRELGMEPQNARGVLPTNISTNIMFKANLRTLHDMALKRLCVRTQGEFQDVFRAMRQEVIAVHPWATPVLQVQCLWNGSCLFPDLPWEKCPVKPLVLNPQTGVAYHGGIPSSLPVLRSMWPDGGPKVGGLQPSVPETTRTP